MARVTPNRVYEDYPPSDLVTEDGCDTILLYLPGYRKEQLRVQLTTSRVLKISGERQSGENRWKRFHKEFRVPNNCDTKEITAKFEGGILYIRQPKMISPASAAPEVQPADKEKTAAEAPYTAPRQQQAPDIPQPQPPQHAPALTQQHAAALPPQPQPQPQLQPEPQKGFEEEKTRRNGYDYDAGRKEEKGESTQKGEEGKDQCEFKEKPKQMGGRGGFFQELGKPENLKRLVVSVLLVVSIGLYATYMFKSFAGDEKDGVSEL